MTPVLEVRRLSKAFGAVLALDGLDLALAKGSVNALIGPNGAGKTTVFNLISGEFRPTGGNVVFNGRDVTRLSVSGRNRQGISRSFQITNIFQGLDVFDNVRIACQGARPGFLRNWIGRCEEDAWRVLEDVGLADLADTLAGNLSHGDQRYLEIAIAIASDPELLLLDEPTSGMTPVETRQAVMLLQRLKQKRPDLSILLIEHDMEVVKDLCETIYVLDFGQLVAMGDFERLRHDPAVVKAYFGED